MKSQQKNPADSEVTMTELVLPQHTNSLGTVFGGVVLSWVDIAAAICAQRHSEQQVVTASIDAMHFLAPIKLGWVVNILARVNFTSSHSCEVGVKVGAENPLSGTFHHTASAFLTMVSVGPDGRPSKIFPLIPATAEDKLRHEAAMERRRVRLELKEKILAIKSK